MMLDELKEPLDKASSKADVATVLVGATVGYALDAWLNIFGFVEPALAGPLCGAGALGLKRAVEAALSPIKKRRQEVRLTAFASRLQDQLAINPKKKHLHAALIVERNVFESFGDAAKYRDALEKIYRDSAEIDRTEA